MNVNWYALCLEPGRILATIIDSELAAELLLAAHPVFLGTTSDLMRLAGRQHKSVAVLGRIADDDVRPHVPTYAGSRRATTDRDAGARGADACLAVA